MAASGANRKAKKARKQLPKGGGTNTGKKRKEQSKKGHRFKNCSGFETPEKPKTRQKKERGGKGAKWGRGDPKPLSVLCGRGPGKKKKVVKKRKKSMGGIKKANAVLDDCRRKHRRKNQGKKKTKKKRRGKGLGRESGGHGSNHLGRERRTGTTQRRRGSEIFKAGEFREGGGKDGKKTRGKRKEKKTTPLPSGGIREKEKKKGEAKER